MDSETDKVDVAKTSAERERAVQFFKARFWNQDDIISQLLTHYDSLDGDLCAEIPLKHIWTVASQDKE